MQDEAWLKIEQAISLDPGKRGIGPLVISGQLLESARTLLSAESAVLCTGFYISGANAFETDGPPGTWSLEHALCELDIRTQIVSDEACVPLLQRSAAGPVESYTSGIAPDCSHLVSIERAGRARDQRYYNLRGVDITSHTAPIDDWFLTASDRDVRTIGIGDGGNEIGMGRVHERVQTAIPLGETIGCVVPTDWLIVAGISNWGAWGLVAGLSLLAGKNLLPDEAAELQRLEDLVEVGAVDGRTGKREPTVDGVSMDEYFSLLAQLHGIVDLMISRRV